MRAEEPRLGRGWFGVLAVTALAALVAWPAWSHGRWNQSLGPLHVVPAFFLGGVVWAVSVTLVGFLVGGFRQGWRKWLRRGGPCWLGSMLVLCVSLVALFGAMEGWRGRRAWTRVAALAEAAGESLDPRMLVPAEVPAADDLWQAPLFEPVRRMESRGESRRADADLGALAPLIRWTQRAGGGGEGGVPGWMTGNSEPPGASLKSSRHRRAAWRLQTNGGPGLRLASTNEAVAGADGTPVGAEAGRRLAADFLGTIESLEPLLGQARDVAARTHCRVPLEPALALLDAGNTEQVVLALERLAFRRARALLELGRNDEAFSDLRLGFELARHARDLPGVYFGRRTLPLAGDGLQALWEGLSRGAWTHEQVGLLEARLSAGIRDPEGEVRRRLRWVALGSAGFVECLIPTAPESGGGAGYSLRESWISSDGDRELLTWLRRLYPAGWSLQNQAAVLEAWLRWGVDWSQGATEANAAECRRLLGATSDPIYPVFVLPKVRQLWQDAVIYSQLEAACWGLAAAACRVERQRLHSRELPETLRPSGETGSRSELAGLHYRRVDGRTYRIHHEGLNGRDDGGDPLRDVPPADAGDAMIHAPDWVWTGVVSRVERQP